MTVRQLAQFAGYTVDWRLRQFRRVEQDRIEFIDFDTPEGQAILERMRLAGVRGEPIEIRSAR